MGYKIGVPSMKLNNSGKKSKHCGSFGGVSREGLEEREGLDKDINHELSHLNIYNGIRSSAELMDYSARHIQELRDASGRKIRADAVVMCTTIFKPPAVYMNKLTRDEQVRFFGDCRKFFEGIVGKDNIKAEAVHFDEKGAHSHFFWEPMTADGRLCAKELHNIKFFGTINENLPAFLREHGWDIDDADCYDKAQREEEDLEKQEEEHYQRRKKQGRSSAAYKLEAEQEKQRLMKENDTLQDKIDLALQDAAIADSQRKIAVSAAASARQEAEKARKEAQEAQELADRLKADVGAVTAELDAKTAELAATKEELEAKKEELDRIEEVNPIKTMEEYKRVAASVEDDLSELADAMHDLNDEFEAASEHPNPKIALEDIKWFFQQKVFPRAMELFDSIAEKVRDMTFFEAMKGIKERLSVSFADRLKNAKQKVQEFSEVLAPARSNRPGRDDYDK